MKIKCLCTYAGWEFKVGRKYLHLKRTWADGNWKIIKRKYLLNEDLRIDLAEIAKEFKADDCRRTIAVLELTDEIDERN